MFKKIIIFVTLITLTSCASLKMPERKACSGNETNKTLAEVLCKK